MGQITITRGLTKLKSLGNEIDKLTKQTFTTVLIKEDSKLRCQDFNSTDEKEISKKLKSNLDKVSEKIRQRTILKRAIVNSNATTKVRILNEEITVADAIELKTTLPLKIRLLGEIESQLRIAIAQKNKFEDKITERLDSNITSLGENISKEMIESFIVNSRANNEVTIVGYEELEEVQKKLQEEILAIENELDHILSESNAITKVEVDFLD